MPFCIGDCKFKILKGEMHMKKRFLSFLLVIAVILCATPIAVSAAEMPTRLDLTFNQNITNTMTVMEANEKLCDRSVLVVSGDSHCWVGTNQTYTCLYAKEGESFTKIDESDYIDTTLSYYVALDIYTNDGYEFSDEDALGEGNLEGFTLTVNGTTVPLNNQGTTHYVRSTWGTDNFQLLIPISYFSEITTPPAIKTFEITPTEISVKKGSSYTFDTNVVGFNGADESIIWSFVEGGGHPTSANTTIANGVITIAEDEATAVIFAEATSAQDSSVTKSLYIYVYDSEPAIESISFPSASVDVYLGDDISYEDTNITITGTQMDRRVEFALAGGTKSGTKINYASDEYASISVDPNETAETLTLTATCIADTTKVATLTINVKPLTDIDGNIYINLNYDAIEFLPTLTESEVKANIESNASIDTTKTKDISLYDENISLNILKGNSASCVSYSDPVDLSKQYALIIDFEPARGYKFSDAVVNGDLSRMHVYINDVEHEIVHHLCDDVFLELYVIPDWYEADIKGASLSLGADLTMNYYAQINDSTAVPADRLAMQFKMNGKTVLVKDKTVDGGNYVFKLNGIAPHQMTDDIEASLVLLDEEGTSVERVLRIKSEYCVSDYLASVLEENEDNAVLKQLVQDVAEYGARSQYYKDYNRTNLPYNIVGAVAPSDATPTDADNVKSLITYGISDVKFTGATVWFDTVNRIGVKLSTADNVTLKVNGAAVELTGTTYYTEAISAIEFGKAFTFELYEGETLVQKFTYSVNSYVCAKWNNSENSDMSTLAIALYRYGVSALAYKNA